MSKFLTTPRGRRRGAIATAAASCAALALSGLGIVAADAGIAAKGATVSDVTLYSSLTNLTSTTGHHLKVGVSASQSPGGKSSISVSLRQDQEFHGWTFKAAGSAISLDDTGQGTVSLASTKSAGYAALTLHVKPVGSAKLNKCEGQLVSETRPVAVSGTLFFNTKSSGSHKWGSIGSKVHTFRFDRPNSVTWSYDNTATCPTPASPCFAGLSWSDYHSTSTNSTGLFGGTSGTTSWISGSRRVSLSKPSGATRSDYNYLKTKAPKLSVAGDGSAALKVTQGTGSATIKSPSGSTYSYPCGAGAKTRKARSWPGSYTNGSTALKVPAQIFGPMSLKNSKSGGYITKSTIVS